MRRRLPLAVVLTAVLVATAAPAVAAAAAARPVTIGWAGDTMLGSRYGLPPHQGRGLLAAVRPTLRAPDLMIGNLEGTFSIGGQSKCRGGDSSICFSFQAPPWYARTLAWAGFDVMSLANNHAHDFGAPGMRQTVSALRRAGVRWTGLPGQITVVRRRGVRIAVVGFAPYGWAQSLLDLRGARRIVKRASRRADVVVVVMHAGAEGGDRSHTPRGTETAFGENRGAARVFARTVIAAGADVVAGSGPHVIRGVELFANRPVFYSAGNFAGYRAFGLGGLSSLSTIVTVTVDPLGRPTAGRWLSLRLVGPGRPIPDVRHLSARVAARLSRQDFGRTALPPRRDGTLPFPPKRV